MSVGKAITLGFGACFIGFIVVYIISLIIAGIANFAGFIDPEYESYRDYEGVKRYNYKNVWHGLAHRGGQLVAVLIFVGGFAALGHGLMFTLEMIV